MTVAFDGTLLSAADSASDGGVWDKANTTQNPSQETDFLFQNTFAQSNKVSNNIQGIEFEDDATVDFTTPRVVLAKVMMATPGTIDLTLAKALWYEIGEGANGGTGTYFYYMAGLYAGEYPVLKSWRVFAIDPNEVAWRDEVGGTVTLSAIDYYAWIADTSASSKSENIIHDRLDYMTNGTGLTFTGTGGSFQDFLTFDFEDQTFRAGVVLPGEAEMIVNGVLTVGTSTLTTFDDTGTVLVFPHHLVGEGFSGVDVGMSNASQDVDFRGNVWIGNGNASTKLYFDSELDVDGTNEEIDITAHGFRTGDYVLYSDEGGTAVSGLTDATNYFVRAVNANSIALYAVGATVGRQNSFTDTTRVGLTAAGTGENHSLIREPDTRPDHTVTGTTGVGVDWSDSTIDGCRVLTFTSKATFTGGFIKNTGLITMASGALANATLSDATTTEGDALVNTTDLDLITGCKFNAASEGHAIETTAATSDGWDNTLSGYWSPSDNGWNFSTAQAFTSEQLNTDAAHGFTTGDAVYYNDEGGVATIGLTDGNKYYVNVVDTDTVTVHLTKSAALAGSSAVNLTTSGSETHSLYSSKAAVFNNTSSGTLTITVSGGTSPSFRNAPGATTLVVSGAVTTFMHVADNDGADLENARVYVAAEDGTGPLPFEASVTSITRATTTATVTQSAHGLVTNDYVNLDGITDKIEDNNGAHQVTVTDANTYTYTTTDSGSTSYTGTITATGAILNGLTDVNGDISVSRVFGSNQPIDGFVRKSSATPRFKTFNLAGNTVNSVTGLSINIRLILDE